jgi:long-chain acyl-CoA synthetase
LSALARRARGIAAASSMTVNIAQLFARHLDTPKRVLYRRYNGSTWEDVPVAALARAIGRWQAAFRREGFGRGDRIVLCVRNGIDWVAIDLAALGLGLVVVPLYVDDNPDSLAWCIGHVEGRLLVLDNARSAASLAGVAADHPPLPRVVVLRGDGDAGATSADIFLPAEPIDLVVTDLPPGTLATICFTSGTAGRPKGVMLSHANILANVEQCRQTEMARPDDLFLSILPLSHMFERTGGYYLPLALGACVAHCRGMTQIGADLAQQQPTVMFAVPRIFERFATRIERALARSVVQRRLAAACIERGNRVAMGEATLLDRLLVPALRRLVGAPILVHLGGRLRLAVVGGAALDPALARTFIGLGLPLLQGYGMTEASPVIAVNRAHDNVPESVGPRLPGIETRLGEDGELLVRGPNVMLGYWRDAAATRAVLAADGWLRTGDLAHVRHGRIYIHGRAKDILVMSNGEKLPPQDVEFAILHDPVFEQVLLVGEGRPYIVLVAVTREADEKELLRRANAQLKHFPRWVRVRRVIRAAEPWSVDNGLMTPTLKLKRPLVLSRLAPAIDAAYSE